MIEKNFFLSFVCSFVVNNNNDLLFRRETHKIIRPKNRKPFRDGDNVSATLFVILTEGRAGMRGRFARVNRE